MPTYVLVHGAWGGAHTFRLVRPLLQAAGAAVFTPSLTGIGERAHLTSPQVRLSTHVQDVVQLVHCEDLTDLVLLGFSYGGVVVTGALPELEGRVRHLVYLDAFVPRDGDTLPGLAAGAGTGGAPSWLVPPAPRSFEDPGEGAFQTARRTPHPVGCFLEPVRVPVDVEDLPLTRTYVRATGDPPDAPGGQAFAAAAARARASPAWRYAEIDSGHVVPVDRPHELARLLLELA